MLCKSLVFAQSFPGYDYVYEVKGDPKYDTGSFTINAKLKADGQLNISGKFIDNSQNPRPFVIITLSTNDTVVTRQADAIGNLDVDLPNNIYTLSMSGNDNINFGDNFVIKQELNQIFTYGCKLYPNNYKIRSKHKLSQTKINKIRRCVEIKLSIDCNSKDSYFIDTIW